MDTLRQICQFEGIEASQKNVPILHTAFLSSVRRHGKVHETEMAISYALRSGGLGGLLKQVGVGLAMLRRGKLKLLPGRFRASSQVRNIFGRVERKG